MSNSIERNFSNIRKGYKAKTLELQELATCPIEQFLKWFDDALECQEIAEPNAMVLATATLEGKPSARFVLLKQVKEHAFLFFTSYKSRKGQEIAQNPYAALTFFWEPLERQVRIEGKVEKISKEESEKYFAQRPKGTQLGAWAAIQSEKIAERSLLDKTIQKIDMQYPTQVPMPEWWGGYRVIPERIEFWQGRDNRLHDRFVYKATQAGSTEKESKWSINRLAP